MSPRTHVALARARHREVVCEPADCQPCHRVQRSRLLEQMDRPWDDGQTVVATEAGGSLAVELEDRIIGTTDDEQGRASNGREFRTGEVGTPAP